MKGFTLTAESHGFAPIFEDWITAGPARNHRTQSVLKGCRVTDKLVGLHRHHG